MAACSVGLSSPGPSGQGLPRGPAWQGASPDAAVGAAASSRGAPALPAAAQPALRRGLARPLPARPWVPARFPVATCDAFGSAARFLVACLLPHAGERVVSVGAALQDPKSKAGL